MPGTDTLARGLGQASQSSIGGDPAEESLPLHRERGQPSKLEEVVSAEVL